MPLLPDPLHWQELEKYKEDKKQGRNSIITVVLVALMIAVSACGKGGPPTYEVTHETGLYASVTSEEPKRFLEEGTVVISANDAEELACRTQTIEGVSLELCHVEVEGTGESGWVLRKWLK